MFTCKLNGLNGVSSDVLSLVELNLESSMPIVDLDFSYDSQQNSRVLSKGG